MQIDNSKYPDVTRFLNRLLGMNLNRQKFMFMFFMASLDNVVITSKRAGTYDIGITTLTGNMIEVCSIIDCQIIIVIIKLTALLLLEQFAGKPRAFTFRGLAAKDDRVYLYKVAQDTGTRPEIALELYNEAKGQNVPTSREWNRRAERIEINTGFYLDSRRNIFRVTPKVWLIINGGTLKKALVSLFFVLNCILTFIYFLPPQR